MGRGLLTLALAVVAASVSASARATAIAELPVNTEAPSVAGGAREGRELSARRGTWTGDRLAFTYAWRRCGAEGAGCGDVAGADASRYALTAADIGSTLVVIVTAGNAAGTGRAASAPTALVRAAPPVGLAPPAISGTARAGETLAADVGRWRSSRPVTYAYQWRRCGTDGSCETIGGEKGSTYALRERDLGFRIAVAVTARNEGGSATASSEPTAVAAGVQPRNTVPPSIGGRPEEGALLTAKRGEWAGAKLAFAYRWQRCDGAGRACADVSAGRTYRVAAADLGATIRLVVVATGPGVEVEATSAATRRIAAADPVNTGLPQIAGIAREGDQLTASAGSWAAARPPSFSYRWEHCVGSAQTCTQIRHASGSSYVVRPGDLRATLRVVVIAAESGGQASATSLPTAAVQPGPPQARFGPQIDGTAGIGSRLTVRVGDWLGSAPLLYTVQWLRCDAAGGACSEISGARSRGYSPAAADAGRRLRVRITASNAVGSASAQSAATAFVPAVPTDGSAPPLLPDLSVLLEGPRAAVAGKVVTIIGSVQGDRQTQTRGVIMTIVLPAGAELVSTGVAEGVTCSGSARIECRLGTLEPGQTATVKVTVRAISSGKLGFSAVLTAPADRDPGEDTASLWVQVRPGKQGPAGESRNVVTGTPRNDRLRGTKRSDVVRGLGGGDRIRGRGGNDVLYGGAGADDLDGGDGRDVVFGGAGNDVIDARDGARDRIDCGPGVDEITADRVDVVARNCERVRRR